MVYFLRYVWCTRIAIARATKKLSKLETRKKTGNGTSMARDPGSSGPSHQMATPNQKAVLAEECETF